MPTDKHVTFCLQGPAIERYVIPEGNTMSVKSKYLGTGYRMERGAQVRRCHQHLRGQEPEGGEGRDLESTTLGYAGRGAERNHHRDAVH